MALTKEDVANRALKYLGVDTIDDLDGDEPEAETMNIQFENVYETLLADTTWYFTIGYQELSKNTTNSADPNWEFEYSLPSEGFIHDIDVIDKDAGCPVAYEVVGDTKVFSNTDGVVMKYVKKPDINVLPPWFLNYFILSLAVAASEDLRADNQIVSRVIELALQAKETALLRNTQVGSKRRAKRPSRLRMIRTHGVSSIKRGPGIIPETV